MGIKEIAFSFCFRLLSKTKVKKKRMELARYGVLFRKSLGQMVRFSIEPGDQINETESPNLVNKIEL